jgi:hypothetical protein
MGRFEPVIIGVSSQVQEQVVMEVNTELGVKAKSMPVKEARKVVKAGRRKDEEEAGQHGGEAEAHLKQEDKEVKKWGVMFWPLLATLNVWEC